MNNLIQGDCLVEMVNLPDKSVDLILCDLPYGTTKCKWDVLIPLDDLWEQYNRLIKDNCAILLFGTEPFSSCLRLSNLDNFKYDWIWDKVKPNGHLVSKIRPMQRSETISVFGSDKINYYPQMTPRAKPKKSKEYSRTEIMGGSITDNLGKIIKDKFPTNIIVVSNASQAAKFHPTQKPTELLEYLIKTYTKVGDTVLDNTMGSGSTGVAAQNLGRNFIGIEKDPAYFATAKDRIENKKV